MQLDELLAELAKDTTPTVATAAAPGPAVDPYDLPWWVVVLSRKPGPDGKPRVKFVVAFDSKEAAGAERETRTASEAERVADRAAEGHSEEPFRFFVIARPEGGRLS